MKALKPNNNQIVSWLLRLGLAFVFLYAAVGAFQHPEQWIGFLPTMLTKLVDADLAIKLIGVFQIVLVIWLLSGRYIKYCAALCAAMLAGIIISSPGQFLITFRDVGLVFMAAALFFVEK